MPVSFTVSDDDAKTIREIAIRGRALAKKHGTRIDHIHITMDVTAVHANGCPLDLRRLLAADDGNFAHDVFGINRHLNRDSGQLENHFRPRFASRQCDAA